MIAEVIGTVTTGKKRGRLIGFPTANMSITTPLPEGIYVAETVVDGAAHPSAAFVGAAKTYGEDDVKLETYILDFDGDIYGKTITVRLIEKIRDNQAFDSEDALISQIHADVRAVREHFSLH